MKFTDQIVDYIEENKLDLSHLTIILPSERAKKYIAASLFRKYKKPILAPEMITIDRWVKSLSEKTVIDKTRALIRLFHIQKENLTNEKDAAFDEFLSWGNIVLSDYDEIDRYGLSSIEVFKNLADIKEIEQWSFGKEELSLGQKRFMEFWDRLPDYYKRLNEQLDKENVCYMGKAYRFLAENMGIVFEKDKKRHFIFAGFNALSQSETNIIKHLFKIGRGHVLINADTFYLDNPNHEAGRFLRKLQMDLGTKNLPFVVDKISTGEKNIRIIECAQHTGQVKAAATILQQLDEKEYNQTLILLADESLVAPLLKNLPKKIGHANITLGLPLRNTALRTWVDLIFSIQENKSRFKSEGIYIHDLQRFWNHPFVNTLLNNQDKAAIIELENTLIERNSIFQTVSKIKIGELHDQLLGLITSNWKNNWLTGVRLIREMSNIFYSNFKEKDAFERAVLEGFDKALQDFENIIQEGIPEMSIKSFKHLFQQHWNTKSIAYFGNPMDGLQIMGLLETRLLDFKKIIVLGMNEGKMPPTNPIQTMIPMDLRNYLKLPTPRDKQGLFAHHFYRLLHECDEMWITYTSAQESIGSNEASRYLLQLELELSRMNPLVKMERQFYSIPSETSETEAHKEVIKTDSILKKMDQIFEQSVSASALNKYLNCSLDFYYHKILEFGEEDTIEEEVESNTFGTFIHNVLEELYKDFARHNKNGIKKTNSPPNITSFDIDKMLACYEELIYKEFLNHFDQDKEAFSTGKNLLSYRMALELTQRILQQEKKFLTQQIEPVFIEYLEAKLSADLQVEINGSKKTLHFSGFIDRIDSIGNKTRIIDYKSGKVHSKDVALGELKDEAELIKYFSGTKHALQLVLYCYLYKQNFGRLPEEAAIYSLINIADGTFPLTVKNMSMEEIVDLFPLFIQLLLEEMYNKEIPFTHKENGMVSYCLYCD